MPVKMKLSGNYSTMFASLKTRIEDLLQRTPADERILIALAGVPGSGKSTFCAALVKEFLTLEQYDIIVVPMVDRKSTRLNSSHSGESRMPSSA